VIERPERLIIGLTSIGLSGLGIPYVLPIGLWGLAAGTAFTLFQRIRAVYVDARSQASAAAPSPAAQSPAAQSPETQSPAAQSADEQSPTPSPTTQPASAQSEEA
jgi:hypothetical protein